MENTGLNIFLQDYLLFNRQTTTERHRILITEIIAHEVAHEWFGNMVTLKWWDELFINEGFAVYLSSIGMKAIDSTIDTDAVMDVFRYSSMSKASWQTSTSIKKTVAKKEDYAAAFDAITYHMTCSCIRMLESAIGRDAMKSGLRQLVRDNKFKNIRGEDVWDALQTLVDDHKVFTVSERKSMLDDVFSLARIGQVRYPTAFKMLRYLTLEDKYEVWKVVLQHLSFLMRRMLLEDEYPVLEAYIRNHLVHPKLRHLGWEMKGGYKTRELKKQLIEFAKENPVRKEMLNGLYEDWKVNASVNLLEFFLENNIKGLGRTMILIGGRQMGRHLVWNFLRSHWSRILSKSVVEHSAFNSLENHDDKFDQAEIEDFVKHKDLGVAKTRIYEIITRVKANVLWKKSRQQELIDWVKATMTNWTECASPYRVVFRAPQPLVTTLTDNSKCGLQKALPKSIFSEISPDLFQR
ncbi:aminopeptidase [Elysia marginata]|uniref:Aminopeptidase n=1 Tax=Elysia marginata TaxID=1093978 RepID=A0AAV4FIF2_9GAST|nr:aminopeptidase [Elysia marginata]